MIARGWRWACLGGLLCSLALSACGLRPAAAGPAGSPVRVVAAENSWGSIVAQLGGRRVHVTSVVSNPAIDPHAYEASPADARAIAATQYVVYNGAGYDAWMPKLLAASPAEGRRVLNVAALVGRKEGDNPHFWYSPAYVNQVVDQVVSDLKSIDPVDAGYFESQAQSYRSTALRAYRDVVGVIRQKYAGAPIGATESIAVYLAAAAGLDLVSPATYMKAVSEGAEPTPADRIVVQRQVTNREVRVLLFNSQNTTPDVNALVGRARAVGVPVVAVTETLAPAGATFQDWQTAQLKSLLAALGG